MSFLGLAHTLELRREKKAHPEADYYDLKDAPYTVQQVFWALSRQSQGTLVIEVPHFPEQNTLAAPLGPVGTYAKRHGYDFARMSNPLAQSHPENFHFSAWRESLVEAIAAHDCREIILVSAFQGAALLPDLANEVNQRHPSRVTALFGLCAQSPAERLKVIEGHSDFGEFMAREIDGLSIARKPCGGRDYYTYAAYQDLKTSVKALDRHMPFNGPAIFYATPDDVFGAHNAARQVGFMSSTPDKIIFEALPAWADLTKPKLQETYLQQGMGHLGRLRMGA